MKALRLNDPIHMFYVGGKIPDDLLHNIADWHDHLNKQEDNNWEILLWSDSITIDHLKSALQDSARGNVEEESIGTYFASKIAIDGFKVTLTSDDGNDKSFLLVDFPKTFKDLTTITPSSWQSYNRMIEDKIFPFASDFARLVILSNIHGIYIDCDIAPNINNSFVKDFDELKQIYKEKNLNMEQATLLTTWRRNLTENMEQATLLTTSDSDLIDRHVDHHILVSFNPEKICDNKIDVALQEEQYSRCVDFIYNVTRGKKYIENDEERKKIWQVKQDSPNIENIKMEESSKNIKSAYANCELWREFLTIYPDIPEKAIQDYNEGTNYITSTLIPIVENNQEFDELWNQPDEVFPVMGWNTLKSDTGSMTLSAGLIRQLSSQTIAGQGQLAKVMNQFVDDAQTELLVFSWRDPYASKLAALAKEEKYQNRVSYYYSPLDIEVTKDDIEKEFFYDKTVTAERLKIMGEVNDKSFIAKITKENLEKFHKQSNKSYESDSTISVKRNKPRQIKKVTILSDSSRESDKSSITHQDKILEERKREDNNTRAK